MVKEIMKQMKEVKEDNPKAYDKLDQRILALVWVLNPDKLKQKVPEKLTFTKEQIQLMAAVW